MKIAGLIDRYLNEQSKTKNAKTIKSYKGRLKVFTDYLTEQSCNNPADINKELLLNFAKRLKEKKLSVNACYVYLSQTKKLLEWLHQKAYLFVNLSVAIELPKWERKKGKQFTHAQTQQILGKIKSEPNMTTAIKARNTTIMGLYLYENLKTHHIAYISIIDLDFTNNEIRLVKAKRFQKIKPETAKLIKSYLPHRNWFKPKNDYLFIGRGGKRLSAQSIGKIHHKATS
jgi:site-specific recombinase XerC